MPAAHHGQSVLEGQSAEELEGVDKLAEERGEAREVGEHGRFRDQALGVPEARAGEGGEGLFDPELVHQAEDVGVLVPAEAGISWCDCWGIESTETQRRSGTGVMVSLLGLRNAEPFWNRGGRQSGVL